MTTFPPDIFERWRTLVLSARSERFRAERDLTFWQGKAADYDQSQPALPNTLAWLHGQLKGSRSLLEVGAGTGRLLLSLAGAVPHVTALDYSPDMLAQLRAKNPPEHVQTVCCALEHALEHAPPHDTVLAAWSLAYQPDLHAALHTLHALSRRDLYLLEDDGIGSPHVQLRRALAGTPKPARASLLREAVQALGWTFAAHTITEERELSFASTTELLAYCRLPLPEQEILAHLQPHLTRAGNGWGYRWTFDVHVLHIGHQGKA
ncbi:class I SAM-dependent methyltransferase [Deinococcus cavernae]|uniref:Class I SAM-dependent methyltransferase n=1 Tax=Deinococcus cavernae TaxID=2320857 RepID=A0A418V7Z1_9DEIO|nr:class I SAM-dependent methyltransferase [Deinococcus cavernae]RJF72196.1 class I SAM-dependent methyltransferase [Deinococcus cavernae]